MFFGPSLLHVQCTGTCYHECIYMEHIMGRAELEHVFVWDVMDFSTIVELARQLHVHGRARSDVSCINSCEVAETVYGRICSSGSHPEKLTDTPGRKTAFVFGPDAISSVILRSDSYSAIFRLGFTKDYIKHEVSSSSSNFEWTTAISLVRTL